MISFDEIGQDWGGGHDGNLIGEFRMIEALFSQSVSQDSHRPFTCAAAARPFLHCLDLASHTSAAADDLVKADASRLFGQPDACGGDGAIGDGMLNVFDQVFLLKYMMGGFEGLLPSDPSAISTNLTSRAATHLRCDSSESYYDYAQAYEGDACVGEEIGISRPGRRRLEEAPVSSTPPSKALLVRSQQLTAKDAETRIGGAWHLFAISGIHISLQLRLSDIDWPEAHPREASLSDELYPWDGKPPADKADKVHLRFAHHCEYEGVCGGGCSAIVPVLASGALLVEETLVYTQIDRSSRHAPCGADFYLWVPSTPPPSASSA
eukprot:CAMPEP_0183381882 /NCGR_PEP_ID=MMETSP0164_2-20130417/126664_1 /TAXON_ID=221442 /ORGANISM="Coccolithus pelagicus ssp braarudi, Strain PLY182g" /LENGTH=321 /DNA_ID=CAMNT_0025559493 /DNA_START=1 /DNA_END=962 /DNA_ORIENTATION=-